MGIFHPVAHLSEGQVVGIVRRGRNVGLRRLRLRTSFYYFYITSLSDI